LCFRLILPVKLIYAFVYGRKIMAKQKTMPKKLKRKTWRDQLHQIVAVPAPAYGKALAPGGNDSPGAFITPASIVTFPVASSVVVVTWNLIKLASPAWGSSIWVPIVLSLVIGAFIYYISLTPKMSEKEKIIAAGIAFINSIFLAASALGISTAIGAGTPPAG